MKTRIQELRKSKNLTQIALAMSIDSSQNTISRIELEETVNVIYLTRIRILCPNSFFLPVTQIF